MNAQNINIYKIYKIKSAKITAPATDKPDKAKSLPKRYMEDLNAVFTDKNQTEEISKTIETIEPAEITEITETADTGLEEREENVFFASLAGMTQNDITLNEVARDAKKPSFDLARYFVLLLSVGIFAFSGYMIVEILYDYVRAAREHDALREIFRGLGEETQDINVLRQTKANIPIQDILALQKQEGERIIQAEVGDGIRDLDKTRGSIQRLADMNSDLYCWIKVSNTSIDYPVVQTTDNDFYLHYNFNKQRHSSGAIYVDYRNSRNVQENRNLILYGHNMLDNSMFQPLIQFGSRRDYFDNGIIELITEDAIYYYEIFSAAEDDPNSDYIRTQFNSDEDYIDFLYSLKERSNFQKNIVFDADSRIITLSTCVNDVRRDWRFVVRGVLIDVR